MDQGDKGNRISSDGRNTWNRAGLIPDPLDTDQYKSYTMSMDLGSGHFRMILMCNGPGVANWSWMRCATALGIILGETYQKPPAASFKLDSD